MSASESNALEIHFGDRAFEGLVDAGAFFQKGRVTKNDKLGDWNAAQTFNHSPDGRTVIIGWLQKSAFYAKKMPFTEQLSFPATLELRKSGDVYNLYRWPIKEIETLRTQSWSLPKDASVAQANAKLGGISPECYDLSMEFEPKGDQDLLINLRGSPPWRKRSRLRQPREKIPPLILPRRIVLRPPAHVPHVRWIQTHRSRSGYRHGSERAVDHGSGVIKSALSGSAIRFHFAL